MKRIILTICGATFLIVTGTSHAQNSRQLVPQTMPVFADRPPPPTEPSITVPGGSPAAKPVADAARTPTVRQKILRPPGKGPSGPVAMPSPEIMVMMLRGALTSINQANFTENYSVVYGLTTPALQARVSAVQFGKAFAALRKQKLDLSPALVMAPQLTEAPVLTEQGVLKLAGFFPTRPLQINFAIAYVPIDGIWSIEALSVSALKPGSGSPMANSGLPPLHAGHQPANAH